jgi:hypothetical protein
LLFYWIFTVRRDLLSFSSLRRSLLRFFESDSSLVCRSIGTFDGDEERRPLETRQMTITDRRDSQVPGTIFR